MSPGEDSTSTAGLPVDECAVSRDSFDFIPLAKDVRSVSGCQSADQKDRSRARQGLYRGQFKPVRPRCVVKILLFTETFL